MSLTNLKMKSKNPQKRGSVRSGADPAYIPGIGSQPNSGQHGSASGPYRMVPSRPSPLGPPPSNKPMSHRRTEEGSNRDMYGSGSWGGMQRTTPENKGELMERYNKEWQRSRERGETIPKNLYGRKKESPLVKAACASDNSAPYGRNRPASSSRSNRPGGTAASPNKGAGRARGVNYWFPNKGIAASADSGESQRSKSDE